MIDSYSFGRMVIDGHEYTKDLMILPDGTVVHPWWRNAGHQLVASDIEALVEASPGVLVVGTGNPGMMTPDRALCAELESQGIRVIVLPTKEAVGEYNALRQRGENVAACFHLTC